MALLGLNGTSIFKYKHHYRSCVLKQILEIQIRHIFMLCCSTQIMHVQFWFLKIRVLLVTWCVLMTVLTAQFKLYARVSVHMCVCTFTACKTGLHMHCCTQLWHAHDCQWTHVTNEWCTSWARTWFATLHVWCTGTVDTYRQ